MATSNTFESMKPNMKEQYPADKKKGKFSKIKKKMGCSKKDGCDCGCKK